MQQLKSKDKQLPIYADYGTVVNNHIIPYFKDKPITELTSKNIRLYYESLDLSVTRKRMNNTLFKNVFLYLEEENHIQKSDIPTLPKAESKTVEARESFTPSDYQVVIEKIKDYHTVGKPNFKTKEYRKVISHYVTFLCETGARPGLEIEALSFNDIKKEGDNYFVKITKGKTKGYSKGRKIVLSPKAIKALIAIAQIQNPDKVITEKLFLNIRKPILEASFGKIPDYVPVFKSFIDYLLKDNLISQKYTLYSCRHYYITKRLSEGVDIYLISKYVGNSVEMIQRFYDAYKLENPEHFDALTGRDREQEAIQQEEEERLKQEIIEQEEFDKLYPNFVEEMEQLKNSKEYSYEKADDRDYNPMSFNEDRETIELELRAKIEQELEEKYKNK
ncbi:MAG: site-specific integrase [Colwellia sp.]|jgi:Phage integrase family.